MNYTFTSVEETVAMSTMYAANHLDGVKAIVALTESGTTPLLMSRISSGLPIFALSPHRKTLAWTNLYRGVTPVLFDGDESNKPVYEVCHDALAVLKAKGLLHSGDLVLLTHGDKMDTVGSTNTCKVLLVE
jgi:pyruvate kinase